MSVNVTRKTNESSISVTLDGAGFPDNYKEGISTPCAMLNHMIEHIIYRSNIGIAVNCEYTAFALDHVVFEDAGSAIGRAFAKLMEQSVGSGVYGYGSATSIIDEARAQAAISFESRALLAFSSDVQIPELCEDTKSEDLKTFLDGFTQGAACTLHIDVARGDNAHHIWEAVYRAVGSALEAAFTANPSRANRPSGVAGKIEIEN